MGFVSFLYIFWRWEHISNWEIIDKMSLAKPLKKLASCVILDLDGTLLNTGQLVLLASFIISVFLFSLLTSCLLF
jgi:hypothetical protein